MSFTEPYLLTLSPSIQMNVCWITPEAYESYVEFGTNPELGGRVESTVYELHGLRTSARPDGYNDHPEKNPPLPAFQHIARLDGLTPGTKYYYRTVTAGEVGRVYHFKTAPETGKSFRFALLSDIQLFDVRNAVRQVGEQDIDFIIYNGDCGNVAWRAGEWFDVPGCYIAENEKRNRWFDMMQQTDGECKLLQYVPIFPCPGNHEYDDYRVSSDRSFAPRLDRYSLSIYMQLFRPLYPDQEYQRNAKHWYSVDYGDLHIVSMSVVRYHAWDGFESPGWFPMDDVSEGSPQVEWLETDLESNRLAQTWVSMHWHMINRGDDGWVPFSMPSPDPSDASKVVYPDGDWCYKVLKPIFEKYGVDAVSFGHSHVYERYLINGIHYIEAASIGNDYRAQDAPYHPSGVKPIVEETRFRSFLILTYVPDCGIEGAAIQATAFNDGYIGQIFDKFAIEV